MSAEKVKYEEIECSAEHRVKFDLAKKLEGLPEGSEGDAEMMRRMMAVMEEKMRKEGMRAPKFIKFVCPGETFEDCHRLMKALHIRNDADMFEHMISVVELDVLAAKSQTTGTLIRLMFPSGSPQTIEIEHSDKTLERYNLLKKKLAIVKNSDMFKLMVAAQGLDIVAGSPLTERVHMLGAAPTKQIPVTGRERPISLATCTCHEAPKDAIRAGTFVCADKTCLGSMVAGHPATEDCPIGDCSICSVRDCPGGSELHYHHDGCSELGCR